MYIGIGCSAQAVSRIMAAALFLLSTIYFLLLCVRALFLPGKVLAHGGNGFPVVSCGPSEADSHTDGTRGLVSPYRHERGLSIRALRQGCVTGHTETLPGRADTLRRPSLTA